ncbi:MAG: exosortase [Gemmatimonadetes bacterium]|nr:exosortase [Gemmatimonadota bacterium]
MTATALPAPATDDRASARLAWLPLALVAAAYFFLFARPGWMLVGDWWNNPEAGHGLLLAPFAAWLAWKKIGLLPDAKGNLGLGLAILVFAVLIRFAAGLAAELFTLKSSMLIAGIGLVVCYRGVRQAVAWWLPIALFALSIPLPELVINAIALPLQFKASQIGAALLQARDIPVLLTGNVIRVPGHELFVAEACSGLRSLTALLSLGVLIGGMFLNTPWSRLFLVVAALPIAVLINGVRIFLTGFLILFVSPETAKGFMHTTEGWVMFIVAFAILGALAWVVLRIEDRVRGVRRPDPVDGDPSDAGPAEVAHA